MVHRRIIPLCGLTTLLIAAAALVAVPTAAQADSTSEIAFDSFTREFNTSQNNASAPTLLVSENAGFRKYGHVQVTHPAIPTEEPLTAAYLRIFVTGTIPAGATLAADLVGNGWTETGLTWANQQAVVGAAPMPVTVVAGWNDIPITATPGRTQSYRIRTNVLGDVNFSSQENADGNGPEVLLETERTAPSTHPPGSPTSPKVFGMSTPASEWSSRLTQVGACGVEARRIFANLTSTGTDQAILIDAADAAGMMPVVSYKVPSVTTLIKGGYDTWMTNAKNYLANLDEPATATFWHEPHRDMTAAEFRQASSRFFDFMNHDDIAIGPILNGWLLDNQTSAFASYTDAALLADWEFVGVDTYQAGTDANPDARKPGGRAVPLLETWLDGQGYGDMPIGVGEYNGWTAASIDYGGDVLRSAPEVWFGLLWNSGPTGLGKPLEGERLAEYVEDKGTPEVKHEDGC